MMDTGPTEQLAPCPISSQPSATTGKITSCWLTVDTSEPTEYGRRTTQLISIHVLDTYDYADVHLHMDAVVDQSWDDFQYTAKSNGTGE